MAAAEAVDVAVRNLLWAAEAAATAEAAVEAFASPLTFHESVWVRESEASLYIDV